MNSIKMVDFSAYKSLKNVSHTGKISANRKESAFYQSYMGVTYNAKKKTVETIIDIRFYCPRETVYCCVWIHSGKHEFYVSGGGSATGSGYDKESASMADALVNAKLPTTHLNGRGEYAITQAITEIMEKLGYKNSTVIKSHG